ncbi:MAG TPA: hypothetical protein VFI43_09530 [Nitrosospira sp.]|nr:hypothetical protein [Nitrosospira sp.]
MNSSFQGSQSARAQVAVALGLAAFVVFALFQWQGNKGFSLWDEGYLWYGVQRVMLGEVPIRDFMSYDPGRYYWAAAFMNLWDDQGIMALRRAVAIFQVIGLFVGLLLIAQNSKNQSYAYLLLSAVTLAAWMYPRHKLFDASLSMLIVGVLASLVRRPSTARYFFTGLCIGLIAIFGRNHGMYGFAGGFAALIWLSIKRTNGPPFTESLAFWAAGITAGFMPIVLMALAMPDFAAAFWDSIRFLFETKGTNLHLPVPWPWRVDFDTLPVEKAVRGFLVGLFFVAIVIFGLLALAWIFWQRWNQRKVSPVLCGAAFMALPYAHYAYSRADVGHLALGIFPFLIGSLAFLAARPVTAKWPFALMLFFASIWVMHPFHPGWECSTGQPCVLMEISGDELRIAPNTADDVRLLRKLADEYAPEGHNFIATPFWPGAYALLERKSPMWAIYALHRRNEADQRSEIARIRAANPGFILLYDFPLDGREELRFRNTHPLIHQYIIENYDLLPSSPNPLYQIFKPRLRIGAAQ